MTDSAKETSAYRVKCEEKQNNTSMLHTLNSFNEKVTVNTPSFCFCVLFEDDACEESGPLRFYMNKKLEEPKNTRRANHTHGELENLQSPQGKALKKFANLFLILDLKAIAHITQKSQKYKKNRSPPPLWEHKITEDWFTRKVISSTPWKLLKHSPKI